MKPRTFALLALVVLALVWGYNWVLMKIAVEYSSPFAFAAERTIGGGIALLLLAPLLRRPLLPERLIGYALLGLFQTAGFLGLVTWAVVTAGAGKVAMLSYTMPFWVVLLAWPLLGERLRAVQGLAIAIALGGVVCMVGPLQGAWFADILAMLAGISWAIGVMIAKRLQREADLDLYNMTMWQMLFGGAVLLLVALVAPQRPTEWSATYLWILAYNIVLASAVGYALWTFVLKVLPAREASMGTLSNPLVGVLASWAQLGEQPSAREGSGMLLVLVGLLLLSFGDRLRLPGITTRKHERIADHKEAG